MTKLDMMVDNQNLRKMLEIMREDIDKHCVDSKHSQMSNRCKILGCSRCVLGKWIDLEFDLVFTGTGTGVVKLMETGLHGIRAGMNTTEIGTDTFTMIADRRRKK